MIFRELFSCYLFSGSWTHDGLGINNLYWLNAHMLVQENMYSWLNTIVLNVACSVEISDRTRTIKGCWLSSLREQNVYLLSYENKHFSVRMYNSSERSFFMWSNWWNVNHHSLERSLSVSSIAIIFLLYEQWGSRKFMLTLLGRVIVLRIFSRLFMTHGINR